MVLGDGHVRATRDKRWKNSFHSHIAFTHSMKQEMYCRHKADLLHSMFGGKSPTLQYIDNNGYPGIRFSKSNKYFRVLRKILYPGGKKTITRAALDLLTDEGLALWWMDDGCLSYKKRDGKIHAREGILNTYVSDDENSLIVKWFSEKYGIAVHKVKDRERQRIRMNTGSLRQFIPIIAPYIIPSMQYKIDMKYDDTSVPHGIAAMR